MLYRIEKPQLPQDFGDAVREASTYLKTIGAGYRSKFVTLSPTPSSLDGCQLSFCFGNQLFLIGISIPEFPMTDEAKQVLMRSAQQANAVPCVLTMIKKKEKYAPAHEGWGLEHAYDRSKVVPPDLETTEIIEMSDWELREQAVSLVARLLIAQGKVVGPLHYIGDVDPSILFKAGDEECGVCVRAVRMPDDMPVVPAGIGDLKEAMSGTLERLFFAGIQCAANEEDFHRRDGNAMPILRGTITWMNFQGLQEIENL
jgi:hypothetical protein